MKEVTIYISSTIRGTNRQNGFIGYVLEYYSPSSKYPKTLYDYEEVHDINCNRAILDALLRALARLREKCILSIYTESAYLYNGFGGDVWIDRWKESGWKTEKGTEVKNLDKWTDLIKAFQGTIYRFYLNESNAYIVGLNADLQMLTDHAITLEALRKKRTQFRPRRIDIKTPLTGTKRKGD